MKILYREPWRGSQICGDQIAYGLPWGEYCGEWKAPGKFFCAEHDAEMVEEWGPEGGAHDHRNWMSLRAHGVARGLEIKRTQWGWSVFDGDGNLCSSADDRSELERHYGFVLMWEGDDGEAVEPSPEEVEKFLAA